MTMESLLKQTLINLTLALLFILSVYYEYQAYSHVFNTNKMMVGLSLWALLPALMFNLGKLLVFCSIIDSGNKSYVYKFKGYFTALLLMINSAFCSFFYISYSLEAPNVDSLLADNKQQLVEINKQQQESLILKYEQLEKNLDKRLDQKVKHLGLQYSPSIKSLEAALIKEMDDKVNGQFIGADYRALEQRLHEKTAKRDAVIFSAQNDFDIKMDQLQEQKQKEWAELTGQHSVKLSKNTSNEARAIEDSRMYDDMLVSGLAVYNAVISSSISANLFIFLFALFIALIVESLSFRLLSYNKQLKTQNQEQGKIVESEIKQDASNAEEFKAKFA